MNDVILNLQAYEKYFTFPKCTCMNGLQISLYCSKALQRCFSHDSMSLWSRQSKDKSQKLFTWIRSSISVG